MSGMLRSTASKVMWVGRATVFAVGLAVILALMFVAASMVLGIGGFSGRYNQLDSIPRLAAGDAGAEQALAVEPLATRRQIEFPRGYAQVKVAPTVTLTGSKGINGVQRS